MTANANATGFCSRRDSFCNLTNNGRLQPLSWLTQPHAERSPPVCTPVPWCHPQRWGWAFISRHPRLAAQVLEGFHQEGFQTEGFTGSTVDAVEVTGSRLQLRAASLKCLKEPKSAHWADGPAIPHACHKATTNTLVSPSKTTQKGSQETHKQHMAAKRASHKQHTYSH